VTLASAEEVLEFYREHSSNGHSMVVIPLCKPFMSPQSLQTETGRVLCRTCRVYMATDETTHPVVKQFEEA
jgi:hypothetical protein